MTSWAIDLGTCNTRICVWNPDLGRPDTVVLPAICRDAEGDDPLVPTKAVPSSTQLRLDSDFWTRVGSIPWVARRVTWGRRGWIGREALERNLAAPSAAFVPGFKGWLGRASHAPLAKAGGKTFTARDVATVFLRELMAEIERTRGERPTEVLITVPVDAFESYRAELTAIGRHVGLQRVRFADEPVAAAVGYGIGLSEQRVALVVDFGGGTINLALVDLRARDTERGAANVVAKAGRTIGGDHVDRWIAEAVLRELNAPAALSDPFWLRQMVDEARRVKELSYSRGREVFRLVPPEHLGVGHVVPPGARREVELDQAWIRDVLESRGLFETLEACVDEVFTHARAAGITRDDVADVLMVGGSSLLPGVYPLFEQRFGRDKVRAWRPFDAVAWGAAALAGGKLTESDFIVHDYALRIHDAKTGEPVYLPVVARGTRFPTRDDHWKQLLVPECTFGVAEHEFRLVIYELGGNAEDERLFGWDADGAVHTLGSGEQRLIVPLNKASPTLGRLDPPHQPGDRDARLDVCFAVDSQRWLVTTVRDVRSGKTLMDKTPVVRLL